MRTSFFMGLAWLAASACAGDAAVRPSQALPLYAQECGACHTAYAPALLSAASWSRIMGGLGRHYGSDASLEPAQIQTIGRWLQAEAATGRKRGTAPPEDRITRADWFVHEHRKVPAQVWQLASVKSASQCGACHTRADEGRFQERELRAPVGMKGRFE